MYHDFVLDGKMPGKSHWVRIGGLLPDAAKLGIGLRTLISANPVWGCYSCAGSYNQ